jgi:hypothetical protein
VFFLLAELFAGAFLYQEAVSVCVLFVSLPFCVFAFYASLSEPSQAPFFFFSFSATNSRP